MIAPVVAINAQQQLAAAQMLVYVAVHGCSR
jgi:hypothetical protein